MNFEELNNIVAKSAGVKVCPICGTPFKPRRSNQITCGVKACVAEHHNEYLRKREKTEEEKEKHREANRKWRAKQKALADQDKLYEAIINKTQKQMDFDKLVAEHGLEYGKLQAEKTLAQVPKIDVNLNTEKKEEDNGKV